MTGITGRRGPLLRLLLAVIDTGWKLAPPSRRREWRRQWRADILHEWRWLATRQRGIGDRAVLVRRVAGALRHAFWLRMHVRGLEMITQDIRYGWRLMVRQPAFTLVAVLTLGLGIGANVTMFSWVENSMRRQVGGVANSSRIVALNGTTRSRLDLSISYPDFIDYRQRRPDSVDDLIAFTLMPMSLRTSGEPVRVFGQLVSANFFDMLGVRVARGRGFRPDEDTSPNGHPVVVFSHEFWQRRFAGDAAVVGRAVTLNGTAYTVVGVAPKGFHGTEPYLNLDLWVPLTMQPSVTGGGSRLAARGSAWLEVMVRLKPGATMARAQGDLDIVARDLAATYADDKGNGVKLYELWRSPGGGGPAIAAVMGIQLGIAGVILLIACANVANLLLARAASRQRETALRLTLGASRSRLMQQLLTESTLLALAGGVCGVASAYWTKDFVRWFIPPAPLPIEMDPAIGAPVLIFAVAVTIVSVLAFGLVPAMQATTSVGSALKESASTVTASPRRARVRQALVAAQVALSLVLLVSAGLFTRTLLNARAADPGFSTRNGLLASIDLLPAGYDASHGRAFFQEILARVREIPGVDAASLGETVPLGFGGNGEFGATIDGYTPGPNEEMTLFFNRVGSDYLKTMGIPLVAGREFSDRDTAEARDITVVNETLARRYFGGRDPIGGRVRTGGRTIEIVGVARDGKYGSLTEAPRPYLYLPVQQWYAAQTVLHVKTASDPAAIVAPLYRAFRGLDANVPLFEIRTIREQLEIASFMQRMFASLLAAFGALALVLSTVGLYGVIAALAVQRTPEIGMRMALGAAPRDIVSLIVRQGLAMTGIGVGLGLVVSFALTRVFRSLLVGISATDGVSFAGTTLLLVIVALVAAYVPARRAAGVDPLTALRHE
jgi:macrolide transport system ATP-binding/permease protein